MIGPTTRNPTQVQQYVVLSHEEAALRSEISRLLMFNKKAEFQKS